MKLKRFLAFAVSVAMVLSIVPAFSLTASAADMTDDALLSYAKTTTALFDAMNPAPTAASDTAIATAWPNSGWSGTVNNGYLNVAGGTSNPRIQCYIGSGTNGGPQTANRINMGSGYGDGKDWVLLSFTAEVTAAWGDVALYDLNDNYITAFRYGTDGLNVGWGHTGWHTPYRDSNNIYKGPTYTLENDKTYSLSSGTTKIDILCRTISDSQFTVTYFFDGVAGTKATYNGSFNGIKAIDMSRGSGGDWQRISLLKPLVYAGDVPETVFSVTATYTLDGTVVNTIAKTYDTANGETGVSFDEYYYSANGSNVMYKADAITNTATDVTVALTEAVENADVGVYKAGYRFDVDGTTATVVGSNLIPNGNFTYGIAGWYNGENGAVTSDGFSVANNVLTASGGTGSGGAKALYRSWAVEKGTTYVLTYTTNAAVEWGYVKTQNSPNRETDVVTTLLNKNAVAGENKYVFVADADYVCVNFGWLNTQFSNFGLYKLSGLSSTYNVTYEDTNGATLKDAESITALSVDALEIPHFDGYILKDRNADGLNVTFTYEARKDTLGTWAIRNNVTSNLYVTDIKYLGTHNAFANHNSPVPNEAGMLINDNDGLFTTTVPGASLSGSSVASSSQTQTLDALEQLNVGVRYFDIRIARHEDGTFWAFHGPSFTELKPVMATIAQFAKENPGEVILLDFQMAYDALYTTVIDDADTTNRPYNGGTEGDDNVDFYNDLRVMLSEAGVMDFVRQGNGAWDKQYGPITDYGTKSAIIPIVKARGWNTLKNYGFANRNDAIGTTYAENSSERAVINQITSVVNDADYNLGSGARWGVIHAYRTTGAISSTFGGTSLIEAANASNSNWMSDADRIEAWMQQGEGDVFMVNNITQAFADIYLEKLSEFNRDEFDEQLGNNFVNETAFVSNGVTLTGPTAALPFSTEFVATKTAATGTMTGSDNVTYDLVAKYELDLRQFDIVKTSGAVLGADATLVFETPGDTLKTYKLLLEDGTVYGTSTTPGGSVTVTYPTGTGYIPVYIAETNAPGVNMTVRYVTGDNEVLVENTAYYVFDTVAYTNSTSDYYITNGEEAFIVKGNEDKTYVVTEGVDNDGDVLDVLVTVVNENAVLLDTFGNDAGSADCNNTDNMLFVGSAGVSDPGENDAAGDALHANAGGNVGSPRIPVLKFNVPTVGENKAVKLHLYVAKANQNLTEGGSMKLAANVSNVAVDEAAGYKTGDVVNTEGVVYSDTMFTATGAAVDGRMPVDAWVEIDVTEFVKAANSDTITFTLYAPRAGAYVADREKAVAGGAYQGKAAYLEIVDANTVTVTGAALVTKSGKDVTKEAEEGILVPAGSSIKARETESEVIAFIDTANVYTTNNDGWVTLTPAENNIYSAAILGVAMVNGAQVRIGDGVNEDGTVAGNSGIRFITTVNKTDSIASVAGATFGVEVTAESSDVVKDIPTLEWQSEGEVYTSALTDLAVSNYNRNFTAIPYVAVNGTKYYGSAVTRSIYQVASGLLATGYNGSYGESADKAETDYAEMPEVLVKVLNGYVNQVGVRLVLADGVLHKSDKYTGDADTFFTVSDASANGKVYTCTLTAVGNAEINTELFNTYVRINNNNSAVKTFVSVVDNGDGTYTLTFDGSTIVK